ncbi:MAG: glutamine synthetase [Myxococcales bacterium]|nr:glutamine synthetase [Myxococcales bacterium]MCB9646395.1 glutamine synthetase [Deltaproteobacteria bacterium]
MTSKKDIEKRFEADGIRRVKLGGHDVDGILRGKYVTLDKFWSIVDGGMGFCDVIFGWDAGDVLYDEPSFTGWHTGYPDAPAKIDLGTYRKIPWEPDTAAFLLDFEAQDGTRVEQAPRNVLKRVLERLEAKGFTAKCSLEFEFFIYKETPWELAEKGYRGAKPLSPGMFGYSWLRSSQSAELVHDMLDQLEAFGVPVEGFHTETGPGVFEAALLYSDALEAADRAALFKTAAKEIGHRHGVMPTFLAKPQNGLPGCSGHTHQSLWTGKENAFYDADAPHKMSATVKKFMAGQLALMPELAAMIAPNTNSYKRLLDGNWAPGSPTWGIENRTCALRYIPGSKKSTRVEHRLPAADVNPYIGMAACLASGLWGIERDLELPPMIQGNAYTAAQDGPRLPHSLAEAVANLERSEAARDLFGHAFVDHYLVSRRHEVKEHNKAVTDWELKRYFELA